MDGRRMAVGLGGMESVESVESESMPEEIELE